MADHNDNNDPYYNRKLIAIVDDVLKKCQDIKPFGYVTKQLLGLKRKLDRSLDIISDEDVLQEDEDHHVEIRQPPLAEDEKYVYFRLYHKDMSRLSSTHLGGITWIQSLIDGVKVSERRGLAVYASEDEARRATGRGTFYAYVAVKIKKDQDVTHRRQAKKDLLINCTLLTIEDLPAPKIFKLHYRGIEFPIVNGEIKLDSPVKV